MDVNHRHQHHYQHFNCGYKSDHHPSSFYRQKCINRIALNVFLCVIIILPPPSSSSSASASTSTSTSLKLLTISSKDQNGDPITVSNDHFRPPRITEHPSDTIVGRNKPTKLDCRAEGNPNPTIEWYKDGKKIGKHHNRMVLPTGSLFFLHVIHNKKDPDTGTYWCVARNEIGKVISHNATLSYAPTLVHKQGAKKKVPTHSPENLRLAVINETSVKLAWSPLLPDQWKGEPKAYFVRIMSTEHRFSLQYNTSSPYQTDLILNNLIYGETYEISVAALTSSGLGPLTEPVPLHMVTSYSYNWMPITSSSSHSSTSSSSSSLSELLPKDATIMASSNIAKDPIFIFSAILALFILSFIILIVFARRHINWNKGMGAYITVQLNNKCDELSDTKFAKASGNGKTGPSGTTASIGNPGYWLTDKKLSTFTSTSSSLQPSTGGPPKPIGQDYQNDKRYDSIIEGTNHPNLHSHPHSLHYNDPDHGGNVNGCGPNESDIDEVAPDEDDDAEGGEEVDDCIESDYAEVEERTLRTFGKRDYSSAQSTEPYATTTLMKSFRGSTENISLLGHQSSINTKSINILNKRMNRVGGGGGGGGVGGRRRVDVVNSKKLNVSAVSLNSGNGHRLSSSSSTNRSNNANNNSSNGTTTSYGKPKTIETGHHVHPHLRTNYLNSSTSSASASSFNNNHPSVNHSNMLNCQSSSSILTSNGDIITKTTSPPPPPPPPPPPVPASSSSSTTPVTGKSFINTNNYSNGNLLNGSNRFNYHHPYGHPHPLSHQQQHHLNHVNGSRGSSGSTSDLVNDVSSSGRSSSSSSSTINKNNNRDNSRSDLVQSSSNVTVHCQYHPIVLASSGSYFEKYL